MPGANSYPALTELALYVGVVFLAQSLQFRRHSAPDAESLSPLQKESCGSVYPSFLLFWREIPDQAWNDGVVVGVVCLWFVAVACCRRQVNSFRGHRVVIGGDS